jgi:peptide/nickel transport system substrate-binding protein
VPTLITPLQLQTIAPKAAVDRLLKSIPQYPFSLARARAELAQSTVPNGFSTTLPTIPLFINQAQAIAGMLGKIGIKMDVKTIAFTDWLSLHAQHDRVESHLSGRTCVPDPDSTASLILDSKAAAQGGGNFASYTSPAADAQIDAARRTADPAKRLAAYGRLLRIVARDVPYVPLISVNADYALSSKFTWTGSHHLVWYGPWALGIKPR